jgi:hypothetical protein
MTMYSAKEEFVFLYVNIGGKFERIQSRAELVNINDWVITRITGGTIKIGITMGPDQRAGPVSAS